MDEQHTNEAQPVSESLRAGDPTPVDVDRDIAECVEYLAGKARRPALIRPMLVELVRIVRADERQRSEAAEPERDWFDADGRCVLSKCGRHHTKHGACGGGERPRRERASQGDRAPAAGPPNAETCSHRWSGADGFRRCVDCGSETLNPKHGVEVARAQEMNLAQDSPAPNASVARRWRTGLTLGRTLYRDGRVVGIVDSPELAAELVNAANGASQTLQDVALAAYALLNLTYDEDDTVGSSIEDMCARQRLKTALDAWRKGTNTGSTDSVSAEGGK